MSALGQVIEAGQGPRGREGNGWTSAMKGTISIIARLRGG